MYIHTSLLKQRELDLGHSSCNGNRDTGSIGVRRLGWLFYKHRHGKGVASHVTRRNMNFLCNSDRMVFRRKSNYHHRKFYFRLDEKTAAPWNRRLCSVPTSLSKLQSASFPVPDRPPTPPPHPKETQNISTCTFLESTKIGWEEQSSRASFSVGMWSIYPKEKGYHKVEE